MSTLIEHRTTASPHNFTALASGVVAAACFVLHAVLVLVAGASMLVMTVPMLVLSALCLGCVASAGRPRERAARITAGLASLAMILMHVLMVPTGSGAAEHHAGDGDMGMPMPMGGDVDSTVGGSAHILMQFGVALAGLQLTLMLGAAVRQTFRRTA